MALAKECELYLEQVRSGCYPLRANAGALRAFDERFRNFSAERFQEMKADALALGAPAGMRMWAAAWAHCQDVSGRLQGKLKVSDEGQVSPRGAQQQGPVEAVSPAQSPNSAAAAAEAPAVMAAADTPTLEFKETDRRRASVGLAESRDSRARQSEEATVTCFNLHFKPEGKAKRVGNVPAVSRKLSSNDLKAPLKSPVSTESQPNQPSPPLTCPAEGAEEPNTPTVAPCSPAKADEDHLVAPQSDLEQNTSAPPLASAPGSQTPSSAQRPSGRPSNPEPRAASRWWRGPREHHSHSEDDLRRMEEPSEQLPCHRALGRSQSEGSCVSAARSSRHTDATSTSASTAASTRGIFGSRSSGSHAASLQHHYPLNSSSQLASHRPRRGSEELRIWPEGHSHIRRGPQSSADPDTGLGCRLQTPGTASAASAEESNRLL